MIRLAIVAAVLALPAAAQTVDPEALPGMPEPYVCHPHADVVTALLAMQPPMPLIVRPSGTIPDGRKAELYGDFASGLFILAYATPGPQGSVNKTSCTIIVGATARDQPIPMTPDPNR